METSVVSEPPVAGSGPVETLSALVHHTLGVDVTTPLADVQARFREWSVDYLAVTDDSRVHGLCSRATVGFLLGSRYGFSLYGQSPVRTACVPQPLIYPADTDLPSVLDAALSRSGSEFFEDVVVVDRTGRLVGLVPVPRLAQLQLRLFGSQLRRVVEQDEELRRQNLELFQINHQLRQSQGRYKALFENGALGVGILDSTGVLVAHNRRFEQVLRMEAGDFPPSARLEHWLTVEAQPRWRELLGRIERPGPAGTATTEQFRFALPGGERTIELHAGWVAETGQVCVFLEDVTDRIALEHQIARQEKQSTLDTLVAGVAHELNNKLTPVLGFAELLEAVAPPALRSHTQCIRQSAKEAAQIIRQLLQTARPAEVDFTTVDLVAICRDASRMMKYQLRESHCEAALDLPTEPVWVQGDAPQLKQVLLNLTINALHAMQGFPQPRLELAVGREAGCHWIMVRDNGSGIPPENLSRIFDPFFTTKGPRGTGLGLSISASIVRQHQGEIVVRSAPGTGSTFTLRLPPSHPQQLIRGTESTPPLRARSDHRRSRVLVVDDEEFVRQFLQEALRVGLGCQVEQAADGQAAVDRLRVEDFDLVISDIRMPRLDGLQLRSWVESHRPDLANRLLFITGHAGATDGAVDSRPPGATPMIRKPFSLDAIVAACEPYLATASSAEPTGTGSI